MSYKHYHKVREFKELGTFFFEYLERLEDENKDLKEKIKDYELNDKAKNPVLSDMGLSVRTFHCIKSFFGKSHFDITLFDIYNCDFKSLKKTKGFGRKSTIEIEVLFHQYGLPNK